MINKSLFPKFFSALTIISLLVLLVGPNFVQATSLSLTSASDLMSNESQSGTSDHTFAWTAATGHSYIAGDTVTITSVTASNFTSAGSWATTDFQLTMAGGTNTTSATNPVAATSSAPTCTTGLGHYTVTYTNSTSPSFVITLCTGFGTTGTAGTVVFKVKGGTGTGTLTNAGSPVSSALWTITNAGSTTDSTTIADVIVANDAVAVSASVASTMTFSVGTGTSYGTTNNGVSLGTIATSKFSDGSATNSIWLGLGTNAPGGASVSVTSSNSGALVSVSKPADTIPYTGGSFAAPTTNTTYGDCVNTTSATTGSLSKSSPFNGTCGHTSSSVAGQLTNTAQTIISSTGLLAGGQAEVVVGATIYAATPAHNDYADTQTFIATGTF